MLKNVRTKQVFQLFISVLKAININIRLFLNKLWIFGKSHPILFFCLMCLIFSYFFFAYTFVEIKIFKSDDTKRMVILELEAEKTKLKNDLIVSRTQMEILEMLNRFCSKNSKGMECRIIKNYLENSPQSTSQMFDKPLTFPSKNPTLVEGEKLYHENIKKMATKNFSLKHFSPDHIKEQDFQERSAKFKKMVEKAIEERKKK